MYLHDQCIILPDKIIFYPIFDTNGASHRFNINDYSSQFVIKQKTGINKNNTIKSKSSDLSKNSFRKLSYACNTILYLSEEKENINFKLNKMFKWRLNFITLDLPSEQLKISDNFILNSCLKPFLQDIRRKYDVHHYIWKAETQGNGNIHFHVVTDKYIYYENIKKLWNSYLFSTGLITMFRNKWNHSNPNSTDIHSIKKATEINRYFNKYFRKKYKDRRLVKCRNWGSSHSLSYEHRFKFSNMNALNDFIRWTDTYIESMRKDFDYCTIYDIPLKKYEHDLPYSVKQQLIEWKTTINSI